MKEEGEEEGEECSQAVTKYCPFLLGKPHRLTYVHISPTYIPTVIIKAHTLHDSRMFETEETVVTPEEDDDEEEEKDE